MKKSWNDQVPRCPVLVGTSRDDVDAWMTAEEPRFYVSYSMVRDREAIMVSSESLSRLSLLVMV